MNVFLVDYFCIDGVPDWGTLVLMSYYIILVFI